MLDYRFGGWIASRAGMFFMKFCEIQWSRGSVSIGWNRERSFGQFPGASVVGRRFREFLDSWTSFIRNRTRTCKVSNPPFFD